MNIQKRAKNIFKIILDSNYRFLSFASRGFYDSLPDDEFIKRQFQAAMGETLNIENPQTFNEKLQWLKVYDRKDLYTTLVDKYRVKQYVADKIGDEYIIPTYGVWDKFEEIDFNVLPDKFVLKCTHDSGGIIVCTDKKSLDKKKARKKIERCLQRNYYLSYREWPYKDVEPRIIAEKYIAKDGTDIPDYKLMCFDGEVKCSFVGSERHGMEGLKVTFYDLDWNEMPFERHYPKSTYPLPRPEKYEEMIRLAEILSKNIPFVRVDFYEVDGKIYFGEMTFFPGSGLEEFTPKKWDYVLGSWINLANTDYLKGE